MNDEYMTLSQVAATLHISRATAYRLVEQGKLTPLYSLARPRTPTFRREQVASITEPLPKANVINERLHQMAKERDGGRCLICGTDRLVTAHHVKPLEQGGADTIENLVTLCRGCNTSVHGSGSSLKDKAKRNGTLAVALWILREAGHQI